MNGAHALAGRRRAHTLAHDLVQALADRIRSGRLAAGAKLPTEAQIVAEFGVSRTVVREALSRLQASGLVQTRHGIGTFVLGVDDAAAFRIAPEQMATLQDVIAVLELRLGVETEAAALAAQRRDDEHLRRMRAALEDFRVAIEAGESAVDADFRFHREIARATGNAHYADLMATLGTKIIPRARLGGIESGAAPDGERLAYLRRVHAEHETILEAIARGDSDAARAGMRTHLANSRERRRRVGAAAAPPGAALGVAPAPAMLYDDIRSGPRDSAAAVPGRESLPTRALPSRAPTRAKKRAATRSPAPTAPAPARSRSPGVTARPAPQTTSKPSRPGRAARHPPKR